MATKVHKVRDVWALHDLVNSGKVSDGDRVCFVVLKHPHRRGKRKWGFVRGMLDFQYRTFCECCGPELKAQLVGHDGKVKLTWR